MIHLVILLLSFTLIPKVEKNDTHLDNYLEFIKMSNHLGDCGNYKDGMIEIVLEKKTIRKIEESLAQRFMKAGESRKEAYEHSKIGIVAKDCYWWWIRDAVIFPSGATGSFNRIVKSNQLQGKKNNSVAIFPVTSDGKIVLNVMYRHAMRDWVLEIPRGKIEFGETNIAAAKRELKEETGMICSDMDYLGEVIPDSGTTASKVPIYFARVAKDGPILQDYSEAILGVVALSKEEISRGYSRGYIDITLKGKRMKVILKDGYLSYALLLAKEKSLI